MSQSNNPVRKTDPKTSHEAAERARKKAPVIRDVVLRVVREHQPLTHDELIAEYRSLILAEPDTPRASDSGIRTRVSELCRAGCITSDKDDGVSNFGNGAKRWITTPKGDVA